MLIAKNLGGTLDALPPEDNDWSEREASNDDQGEVLEGRAVVGGPRLAT